MSYLKTVITYNVPAEAEVDKSYLEAHGLVVGLLNANTARNELGAPFYIQLQVADEDHQRAVDLLRAVNPSRFGSEARVAELDRGIRQAVRRFFIWGMPAGIIGMWVAPASDLKPWPALAPPSAWALSPRCFARTGHRPRSTSRERPGFPATKDSCPYFVVTLMV